MQYTRVTLRIPKDLADKAKKIVSARKQEDYKFSMNEWIVEAIFKSIDDEGEA